MHCSKVRHYGLAVGAPYGQLTVEYAIVQPCSTGVVNVTEFKATCLALLDEIGKRGGTITITKRGRPLATMGPARMAAWRSPEGSWMEKVTIARDIAGTETAELWDVLGEQSEALV